jgi:acetyl-CoA synthetase
MSQNIESILHETRVFPPTADFAAQSHLNAEKLAALYAQAEADHEGFWANLAREHLTWQTPFTRPLNADQAPHYRWFEDGQLNVSFNCLDRHLPKHGEKTALISIGEPGDVRRFSYKQLHQEVSKLANVLKTLGIEKGDRVIIYLPHIAEAVMAMQACARIGAIHSVVFGGFSAEALKDRAEDAEAKLIITADGGFRGGRTVALKAAVDKALAAGCASVEKVLVYRRTQQDIAWVEGRDFDWQTLIAEASADCPPLWVAAEHPLFLLYTSGSTGKPKGIQHASAGYLLNALLTMQWVFDIQNQDVFWCTADVGWITGHSYVAYGPLANAATQVLYEGAPTVPDGGRFWKICQAEAVSIFYTAPTAIRALMKLGDAIPQAYDLSKLRLLGTVGEPINPEAWMWYYTVIGQSRCPIVDTWWQTETGAHMIAPVPAVTPLKPGSCTKPLPGIDAAVVNEAGEPIQDANEGGYLVIKKPWPSMLRTIWRDAARYQQTYWAKFSNRYYLAGDSAHRDADGYFWILGRIDDVLNVSGHRLGTMEIESALVAHPEVAEAAVVGQPHAIKGEAILAFVVLKGERPEGVHRQQLTETLRAWVAEQIGPIAKPDEIRFADNLPKTRSGKIMRRLLRTIGRGEPITQDTSTLENEAILLQLQERG